MLDSANDVTEMCLNTDCDVSLADKVWAKSKLSNQVVSKMTSSLRVRDVKATKHETSDYITTSIYLSEVDDFDNRVLACIRREIHLVDDLRIKMLIENDIISSKNIVIDIV